MNRPPLRDFGELRVGYNEYVRGRIQGLKEGLVVISSLPGCEGKMSEILGRIDFLEGMLNEGTKK